MQIKEIALENLTQLNRKEWLKMTFLDPNKEKKGEQEAEWE